MKNFFLLLLMLLMSAAYADENPLALEKAPININDQASIERGGKFFSTVCMACHTLIYLRYDKLAQKAGVIYEKMPVNVKWPPNAIPPDLSLEADVRGADWIYTYLHSFYVDSKRPTGFNNLLVPNTMMPGIISIYQGRQMLSTDLKLSQTLNHEFQWYDLLTLQKQGIMTPQKFDDTIADVVNFLVYASEPFHEEQTNLGWKVLVFLAVFFVFSYLLKKAYWKQLKENDKE
jgi:ubiquinol-cytochrome c reductase cytochrome c1 subunit